MRRLSMIGVTHRRASLALLERVAIRPGERAEFLEALRHSGCAEAVVLSTCSRTEIYAHAAPDGPQGLLSVLASHAARPRPEVEAVAEIRTGRSVVEHLFRVTAGLDSRVVGEVDIHGQARAAFRHAAAAGMAGPSLGRLFPEALRCSTRVRTETALGLRARSLGQRAVDVGLETFPAGAEPAVLVVGSGRMASSAVEHLVGRGRRPLVAARNEQVAAKLAGAARVVPLAALAVAVREADLIICATSAASHVVTLPHVRQAMVSRVRPLTVVDLSVPRNVDPQVAALPGVRLIDLEEMYDDANVDASLIAAVQRGRVIAKTDAQRYADGHAARQAGPVIAAIRARVEQTCMTELVRVAAAGAAVQPQDLERAAHAVAGKLLHLPIVTARAAAASGQRDSLLMLCEIFGVHADDVGLSSTATAPERTLLGGAVSSL
ncbi:MAG: glutamyl-tRNA reductase [Actinomycetota bacterium]|jgi:glutamyl-tRNA reductase|nr:glutamyl-tRNA reductase [Actinomycetota bacterium]